MSADEPLMAVVALLPRGLPRGKARVELQSLHARYAVKLSADLAQAQLAGLPKNANGAPLPSNGWYWSLSHCASSIAGVVHRAPVGIDVEDRRDIQPAVVERVLHADEIALFERRGEAGFLRAWTAKEALLKQFGLGLGGLSRCRVVSVAERELVLELDGRRQRVHQLLERNRVVSVSSADEAEVRFTVFDDHFRQPADELRWA